ncbi:carboxylesterase/lipase family protein [Streptomyces sp. WMMC905]|uniref:carboxylesterase/lipase family protein n=1 Tax=Streptomyces sp. WMMC905 TaxID=3404123 RepID=UPI003B923B8C
MAGTAPNVTGPRAAVEASAARPPTSNAARPVVGTRAGLVAGERVDGVAVFRGIPYTRPPVGPLRFASPRPPRPWRGVREAVRPAPACWQAPLPNRPSPRSGEGALHANVWTPDTRGSRPVLVYVHGGGWATGSGSLPTYDATRLACRGDLVVVTFDYRLGVFGFGLHESLADHETGEFANWGLQDQRALLSWVHENAAAFGGDPGNVTLCGTSAGAASVWQLACLPQTRGLIRRIVPISPSHALAPATSLTREDARTVHETLARSLGTTVPGLRDVPANSLGDAWHRLFAGPPDSRIVGSGRWYRGPVVDGRTMPAHAHDLPTVDLPVMSVHTRTEGSFYTGPASPQPAPAPNGPHSLRRAVLDVLRLVSPAADTDLADTCVGAYREVASRAGLREDPRSLWTEIWGDLMFRHHTVRFAERHARLGTTPWYAMEFAHPARPPHFGTPHEATSPFLFGTHRRPPFASVFGDGPVERLLSDLLVDAVAAFARTSCPRTPALAHWPPFTPHGPSLLVLGGTSTADVVVPDYPQLRIWDLVGRVPRS